MRAAYRKFLEMTNNWRAAKRKIKAHKWFKTIKEKPHKKFSHDEFIVFGSFYLLCMLFVCLFGIFLFAIRSRSRLDFVSFSFAACYFFFGFPFSRFWFICRLKCGIIYFPHWFIFCVYKKEILHSWNCDELIEISRAHIALILQSSHQFYALNLIKCLRTPTFSHNSFPKFQLIYQNARTSTLISQNTSVLFGSVRFGSVQFSSQSKHINFIKMTIWL